MTTVAVRDLSINGYILSVTTRNQGDTLDILEELTFRTVSAWLFIADLLERNVYEIKAEGSIEERFCKDKGITLKENFGDSRVTIWDTYRGQKQAHFHLNSDDNTQAAIDTWVAQTNALERVTAKYTQNAPQTNTEPPPQGASPIQAMTTQNTPVAPIAGVLTATRAPNPKVPQYANGQLVSFMVNRIVATSNNGSACYQLWTALGLKYPTLNVYKFKPGSQDLNPNFTVAQKIIESLGLSLDKPEVSGNWFMVCRASHAESTVDGVKVVKEYLNLEKLEVVQA